LLLSESQQPTALIIDLDVRRPPGAPAGNRHPAPSCWLRNPVFLADRGDITARLDAVEAGGAGYFIKPVDIPLLLER
jgi:DNA-binding response OmpR family regulator